MEQSVDINGNGVPDEWEEDNLLDLNSVSTNLGGQSLRDIWITGEDPLDPETFFAVKTVRKSSELAGLKRFDLRWPSQSGREYELYWTGSLTGEWNRLGGTWPATPPENTLAVFAHSSMPAIYHHATVSYTGQGFLDLMNPYVAPPYLAVSTNKLEISLVSGTATSQTIQVWNAGAGQMDFQLAANAPWLSVTPATGSSSGQAVSVVVTADSALLATGTYNGVITVTAPSASNSPALVACSLVVRSGDIALTNGLIVHYPLNGNANDASGNGFHGTVLDGSWTSNRFGVSNAAFYLDGINDRIQIPEGMYSPDVSEFTVSLWVKAESSDPESLALYKAAGQDGEFSIGAMATNIGFSVKLNDANWYGVQYPNGTDVTHVVGIYRRNQLLALYKNGVLVATTNISNTALYTNDWAGSCIGSYNWSVSHGFFKGTIEDIRIYDRALSLAEIAYLYSGEGAKPASQVLQVWPTNLVVNAVEGQTVFPSKP